MADFPISSLTSGTLASDSLLLASISDGNGGYDSASVDAQQFAGIAVKQMSQTDYDNLSPAEKANGTLYITDGTPASETPTSTDTIVFNDVSDSDKPKSTTLGDVLGLLSIFKVETYTATKSVTAGGVVSLTGNDLGYTSIPSGYTPIAYTFKCNNSNDLFFNLSTITATGATQFGVIRNISTGAQNDKNIEVSITFAKTSMIA